MWPGIIIDKFREHDYYNSLISRRGYIIIIKYKNDYEPVPVALSSILVTRTNNITQSARNVVNSTEKYHHREPLILSPMHFMCTNTIMQYH